MFEFLKKKRAPVTFAPSTCDDLTDVLIKKVGTGDARKFVYLLNEQRLKFVSTENYVPAGFLDDGVVFYNDNQTYIVASRLNKETLFRDLIAAAKRHTARRPQDLPARWI
jgi:hypothetical protein